MTVLQLDFNASIKVTGKYRAVVHTGHEYDKFGNVTKFGEVLRETPFGPNVITLTGFGRILQNQATGGVMVCGTGNTAPVEGDTTLVAYAGKTNTLSSQATTRNTTPDGSGLVWWRITTRCTFLPGSMGGGSVNVAEAGFVHNVAFGSVNSSSAVSSRGLLVDGGGSPTTISINNAIEYLDIIWEYTEYIDASATGVVSIDVDGVPTNFDYEVRPYYFDNTGGSFNYGGWQPAGNLSIPGYGPIGDGTYSWAYASNVFAGPITPITGNGLGAGSKANLPTMSSDAYTSGDKHRIFHTTWIPNQANIAGGIGVVRCNLGHTSWQVSFSPKLDKTDLKQLVLDWRLDMANQ